MIRTARLLILIPLTPRDVLPVPQTDVETKPVITLFRATLVRGITSAAEPGSIAPAQPVPTAQKDVPIIA